MDFCKQYPSGLRLIAKRLENYHTVSLGVMVDVGCVKENQETNGYSHLIEHMVFKGTAKRTAFAIAEEMDDIGANMNAYTSKDSTCFYTKSLSEHLEKCIDVLSDMYFDATFPDDEFEREKGVVLEEIKMCNDTPDDVSQDLISEALFYGQTLGQTILGKPENIKYCDRHNIIDFKKRYYTAKSTVISVCGAFDTEQLDLLVKRYFEDRFVGNADTFGEPPVEYCNKFLHVFKDIEQSHLQVSWGARPLDSDDRYAVTLLSSILGGGMTSRLYQVIREQNGLAYTVYAYPSYYLNGGSFDIYAGLGPENNAKVCDLLRAEIDKMLQHGITAKELERAVTQAVNSLYMSTENNLTLMRLYGRRLLKQNKVFDAETEADAYKNVSADDVNRIAREILSKPCASSYVGPHIDDCEYVSKIKLQ